MKLLRFASLWLLVVSACLILAFGFKSGVAGGKGQSPEKQASGQAPASESGLVRLSSPAKVAPGAASTASALSYEPAARENEQLQATLGWTFGGKLQRGWSIYTPLIANLIEAESEAPTNEFAGRLSVWQKSNGVQASGKLENDTWSKMVSVFQSNRIARPYLTPNRLVTIPASDCYDASRPEALRQVEPETFAAYKRMVAAAAADSSLKLEATPEGNLAPGEKFLKIVSAYRSREYQDQLRKQSPNSGRAGLAINSPHSTGRALDLYVGGEPVNTKDDNRLIQTRGPVYRWLVKNASRFGFKPYFYEPWHWEYVGESDRQTLKRAEGE